MNKPIADKLQQKLKSELSELAQKTLNNIGGNDIAKTGKALMMKFLDYKKKALHYYEINNCQNIFDVTLREFEQIIDESVPEVLEKYLKKK